MSKNEEHRRVVRGGTMRDASIVTAEWEIRIRRVLLLRPSWFDQLERRMRSVGYEIVASARCHDGRGVKVARNEGECRTDGLLSEGEVVLLFLLYDPCLAFDREHQG